MKHSLRLIGAALLLLIIGTGTAGAQYYQIANQIPGLLQPALSGGLNYKGYVDGSYVVGMGNRRADFLELTTTQGFRYSSWFFMGVGAGVQVMFSDSNHPERPSWPADGFDPDRGTTRTACMIPLYTDFRFNIGGDQEGCHLLHRPEGGRLIPDRQRLYRDRRRLSHKLRVLLSQTGHGSENPPQRVGQTGHQCGRELPVSHLQLLSQLCLQLLAQRTWRDNRIRLVEEGKIPSNPEIFPQSVLVLVKLLYICGHKCKPLPQHFRYEET